MSTIYLRPEITEISEIKHLVTQLTLHAMLKIFQNVGSYNENVQFDQLQSIGISKCTFTPMFSKFHCMTDTGHSVNWILFKEYIT